MMKDLFSTRSRSFGVSGIIAVLFAGLSAAPALAGTSSISPVDTSGCSAPQLSQPFLSAKDSNWYTLVPGQSTDNFAGGGWTLSGGAQVTGAQLADGQTGSVLDLPSGSSAVSPPMCVSSDYPTARTMVRDVVGSQGVHISVSYAGTKTGDQPQNVGQVHGQQADWTISNSFNVHPGKLPGWHLVQFTLTPGGQNSDFQVYNFWVDPRMCG
jgi:hypothetical protein